jgi:phage tail sheath protein FI
VRCDESTTTAADRRDGRLIALVGVAPSRPFEFVVVRIGVEANALEIDDATVPGRAA